STAARQHGSTAARQHGSTAARQHGSTAARQHGSTDQSLQQWQQANNTAGVGLGRARRVACRSAHA
ncbi:hypothetical protein ACFC77_08395, partial [Nocardia colli]